MEDAAPVYVTYFPDDFPNSPRTLYASAKEAAKFATSPQGKLKGTRFKRFDSPLHANEFLSGDYSLPSPCRANSSGILSFDSVSSSSSIPAEPTIPHPSVSRIQMTELKKFVEKDDLDSFNRLVDSNPRFLVNTSGDTPAIAMEGFRYNYLHIAAKAGSKRVTERILQLINDVHFLVHLYGTTEADARLRMRNIVDAYLNTPDKGANNTPLHFAVLWGRSEIVRLLVAQKALDKNVKNKEGLTPMECVCGRYNEEDKARVKHDIELLLHGCYVALYKEIDHKCSPKLIASDTFPQQQLPSQKEGESPLSQYTLWLSAFAGPFNSKTEAEEFIHRWTVEGKAIKRSDIEKGFERVGRELAAANKVGWKEAWTFLPKKALFDWQSEDDLAILDEYLKKRRMHIVTGPNTAEPARKKLVFAGDEESDEEFFDAENDLNVFNDSLASLNEKLAAFSFESPAKDDIVTRSLPDEDEDADDFMTPRSSPPPVFLLDEEPIKTDGDLFAALQLVDAQLLDNFPNVTAFMRGVGKYSQSARSDWPSLDSPRRLRYKQRII